MNPRTSAVSPGYGHFLDAEPEFAGEKKNLRIESPALDFLRRENFLHCPPLKSLEAALRVLEVQAESNSQQKIENAPEDLPVNRLPLRLQFGLQPARSDRDIGAVVQSFEKFGKFLDRRGQIGIAENH